MCTIASVAVVAVTNEPSEAPERSSKTCGQATGAASSNLDRDPDQRLLPARTAASKPFLQAPEVQVVDLDLVLERLAQWGDHRAAEFVQHDPCGLMAADAELAL